MVMQTRQSGRQRKSEMFVADADNSWGTGNSSVKVKHKNEDTFSGEKWREERNERNCVWSLCTRKREANHTSLALVFWYGRKREKRILLRFWLGFIHKHSELLFLNTCAPKDGGATVKSQLRCQKENQVKTDKTFTAEDINSKALIRGEMERNQSGTTVQNSSSSSTGGLLWPPAADYVCFFALLLHSLSNCFCTTAPVWLTVYTFSSFFCSIWTTEEEERKEKVKMYLWQRRQPQLRLREWHCHRDTATEETQQQAQHFSLFSVL